jgi:hypothetical protein
MFAEPLWAALAVAACVLYVAGLVLRHELKERGYVR